MLNLTELAFSVKTLAAERKKLVADRQAREHAGTWRDEEYGAYDERVDQINEDLAALAEAMSAHVLLDTGLE